VSLTLRGGHQEAFSDVSFLWSRAEGRWVRRLAGPLRLLLRAEVGGVASEELRGLPASLRFFAGGDQSIRGYGFRELGPSTDEGEVIGGAFLTTGTVEVDALLVERWGRWGVALFYDLGNATERAAFDPVAGAGVGLRWLSPVGMVRLDAAWALDHPGTPLRLHFSLGPDL
jgi:translocation and assembly module TamA